MENSEIFCNFVADNQQFNKILLAMISKDKVIEIFFIIDEFCKEFEEELSKQPVLASDGVRKRNRKASMSHSEIMTILLLYHFGTFRNFKHFYLHYVKVHLAGEFPTAVSYNRFVELEGRVFFHMMFFLNLRAFGTCTGITFVDSTMIPVCHNLRRYANRVFKGLATDGKGTMGWCHGFKLHFVCNDLGEIITFVLTGANVDDRDRRVWDGRLFGDKGYISTKLFDYLFQNGTHIITGLKSNMKNRLMPLYDKVMLRKRYVIETINDLLKNTADLVHSRHRSIHNFIMNLTAALGAYCFFDNKPTAIRGFYLEQSAQLSIF